MNATNTKMASLSDQAARADIVNELTESFFVEAGAGSGKTASLVRRLVNLLLLEGVDIDNIAAITFTEAAGNELCERLRKALTAISLEGSYTFPGGETVDYSGYKQRCGEVLAKLPGAAIGTLHSFALRILRMFPLEAGLPPEISAASDNIYSTVSADTGAQCANILAGVLIGDDQANESVADALRFVGHDFKVDFSLAELKDAIDFLIGAGMQAETIEKMLAWMDEHWGELEPTIAVLIPSRGGIDKVMLERTIREFELIAGKCTKSGDKLLVAIQSNIDKLRAVLNTGPIGEGLAEGLYELSFEPKVGARAGAAKAWGGKDGKDEAIKDFGSHAEELIAASKSPTHRALAILRRAMAALVWREANARVRSGVLEFNDMVFLADKLIENDDVVANLGQQFQHVFVDEFQDTDPVQYRLVTAITRAGTLFTVGDPKQSIYRFRRADVSSYLKARRDAGEEKVKLLNTNFRSAPGVLEPLNALFADLFTEGNVEFSRLEVGRIGKNDKGAVYFIGADGTDSGGELSELDNREPFDETRQLPNHVLLELGDILATIREAETGRWTKPDSTPIELKDIAVLVPTHAVAHNVMEMLQSRNIPFVSEGALKLFGAPEIVDLVTVIRAVSDPADGFAQVAALRSGALGCSDADLLQDRLKSGSVAQVEEARKLLQQWRGDSKILSIGDLVAKILRDIDAQINVIAWKRPQALTRLRAFEEACRNYSKNAGGSLRSFVLWAERNAEESNREAIADPVLDTGADGVRVMTIHASKGREFPMVILAGMSAGESNKLPKQLFHNNDGVIELDFSNKRMGVTLETQGFADANMAEKTAKAEERVRLDYVAMTRAENVLVVPLRVPLTKQGVPSRIYRGAEMLLTLQNHHPDLLCRRPQAFPQGAVLIDEVNEEEAPVAESKEILDEISAQTEKTTAAVLDAGKHINRIAATKVAHASSGASEAQAALDEPGGGGESNLPSTVENAAGVDSILADLPDFSLAAGDESLLLRAKLLPQEWIDKVKGEVELLRTKPATERGRGNVFGTAVHAVMERINFDASNLEQECQAAAAAVGLDPELLPELDASVRSLVASKVFQRIGRQAESGTDTNGEGLHVWRELPVIGSVKLDTGVGDAGDFGKTGISGAESADVTVEGVVDVLYETPEGELVIADYKTDYTVTAQMMAEYFGQLKIYAEMLQLPVARLELIFARDGEAEVRTLNL